MIPDDASTAADAGALHGRLRGLLTALGGMVSDRVLLLSLELRLAGRALGVIVALAIAASVAALTAWLGLWLAIGAWIVARYDNHAIAALVVILANGVLAAVCIAKARRLVKLLTLPATMRALTGAARGDEMPPGAPIATPQPEAPVP